MAMVEGGVRPERIVAEFAAFGSTLVAISPQIQEYNRKLIEEKKLAFELLSDPGNEVAQQFGLKYAFPEDLKKVYLKFGIDLEKYNGDDSWTLPLPARFIIDQDEVVKYAETNVDYTIRP
ncbi:MAG: redoxin domain-containing protein [Deltaproteobacteria bacterium]|nr:MAG: redoxin domain-containing protein [Deltaproteobacteria bacterium]